jgi:3-hydroxypropionate dehydrogenase (NADP+)
MIIESIAIVGAGLIGSSWAAFYASKGFRVKVYDIDPEICRKGWRRAKDFIETLKTHGLLSGEDAQKAFSIMTIVNDLEEAVDGVQLVQESVLENYEVKQKIFKALDAMTPSHVILASSSSGLLMTKIQEVTQYPERCLIDHPFNPPHLIPLVELVPGQRTLEDTITRIP